MNSLATGIDPPKLVITTSWDDGFPSDRRLADLLTQFGLSATFYIPRNSQRETLSESGVARLAVQFEIGAHTLDHLSLRTLDDATAHEQIAGSKQWVEQVTGKPCLVFCPPLGKYHRRHVTMIGQSGYRGFRTVEMASTSTPRVAGGLIEMATTIQAHPHQPLAYLKNALRRHRFAAILKSLTTWTTANWESRADPLIHDAQRHHGVFHLWGHSWEIDEHDQWKPLEVVCRRLGELVQSGQAVAMTNGALCQRISEHQGARG